MSIIFRGKVLKLHLLEKIRRINSFKENLEILDTTMYQKRINRTTKSTIFFGLLGIIFISFAIILFMVDLTSKIRGPGIHGHRKKSALSLFTEGNSSSTRRVIGQLSLYQAKADNIKRAFPTSICSRPQSVNNSADSRIKTDMSSITLDELSWETFGDNMPTIGKLAHLSNRLSQEVNKTAVLAERNQTVDEVFHELGLLVDVEGYMYLPGGHWRPLKCAPKWKVAIVIPFRDRVEHLAIFLRHMIPLLQRQNLEFSFFVVEQNNNMSFNRAMLLNVGFIEALKLTRYDCFIFHDVDHLPINVNNYYGCDWMPRHFISGDDVWNYKILYPELFGGVTGLTTKQMHKVNGFSNVYWGWGAEDDDIFKRIMANGYFRSRPEGSIGYYNTIKHEQDQPGRKGKEYNERVCLLNFAAERMNTDGLNSIEYPDPYIDLTPLFTKISVDISELPWKKQWANCSPDAPGPVQTAVERRSQPFPDQPAAPAAPAVANVLEVNGQADGPVTEGELENKEAMGRQVEELMKER